MPRPRLLDLFCGAGGAAMGYSRAGFDVVVGVDIEDHGRRRGGHYPFDFVQADALFILETMVSGGGWSSRFDAIHASPPCQAYSVAAQSERNRGKEYPDLLGPTRELLKQTGLPWVIENVPGAPMRADFKLCGCQFGLRLRRERWFETSWEGFAMMTPCSHDGPVPSVVGHGTPAWVRKALGYNPQMAEMRECMGIDWMNRAELTQAIPPAYGEWIGRRLMEQIERVNA